MRPPPQLHPPGVVESEQLLLSPTRSRDFICVKGHVSWGSVRTEVP